MTTPVLLALTGSAFESSVVVALQSTRREGVHIVRRCVDVADLVSAATTGRARAALIAADLAHLDVDVVARLRAASVEPLGVVVDDGSAAEHRLHQIGIRAVLHVGSPTDLATQVVDALARTESVELTVDTAEPGRVDGNSVGPAGPAGGEEAEAADGASATGSAPGRVVAVWGPAGAPGRTTVAVGLSAELAELGVSTLLVDADVYGGSVAQQLAMLDEASGVLAAARDAKVGALDSATLSGHCRTVGGFRVLTGLPRADRWPELSPVALSAVLTAARGLSAVVVVDCGFCLEADEELSFDTLAPRRNGATLQVLEEADRVLAVGTADPVGLSRLARAVVDLPGAVAGCEPDVVINRLRPSLGWSAADAAAMIERFTGPRRILVLPDDREACDACLVHGQTLAERAPRSGLRTGLRELAAEVAGLPAPPRRRGLRAGRRSTSRR